jgi:thiamine transport system permease protein
MSSSKAIRFFFILIFLAPYFLLLSKWNHVALPPLDELGWILRQSMAQATFSAVLSILLGFWWARGLLFIEQKFSSRQSRALEFFMLLPQFLPALFILLIFLALLRPFPFGVVGVVLVHGFLNAGLAAIYLKDLFQHKLLSLSELCWVEGGGLFSFWREGFRLLKTDFIWLFAFLFILCFCSFSVPLIAGGGKATTLEVYIYEKIRTTSDWSQAVGLSFLQLGFLFLFSFLPSRTMSLQRAKPERTPYLRSFSGGVSVTLISVLWVAVFLWQTGRGFAKISDIPGLWEQVFSTIPLSLAFSFGVGILLLIFFLLSALAFPDMWLKKFFAGFVAPSTALLGFVFLFSPGNADLKWAFAFVILVFATLYRWGWSQRLESLRGQVSVAGTMGASRFLIFQKILAPQVMDLACRSAAVGALWALGDFALSKIIIGRPVTLGLLAESMMSSYRIEGAMTVTAVILLFGFLIFAVFRGVESVARRKLEEEL